MSHPICSYFIWIISIFFLMFYISYRNEAVLYQKRSGEKTATYVDELAPSLSAVSDTVLESPFLVQQQQNYKNNSNNMESKLYTVRSQI
jgi:hypothetical protein